MSKSYNGRDCDSYLDKQRMKGRRNEFSKPFNNNRVSKKDEEYIDKLEAKFKKRHK